MSRIIDLISPDTINKTIGTACGFKMELYDIINDSIFGAVYFGDHPLPMEWKADGFPVNTKEIPENYHLRLIKKGYEI